MSFQSVAQIEHNLAFDAIGMCRQLLTRNRPKLEALIQADRDLDNFGHIVDPTLWKRVRMGPERANYEAQIKIARATIAYLSELDTALPLNVEEQS